MTSSKASKARAATAPKPDDVDHKRDLAIENLARKQARVRKSALGPTP